MIRFRLSSISSDDKDVKRDIINEVLALSNDELKENELFQTQLHAMLSI
jgi:hypothetical protein